MSFDEIYVLYKSFSIHPSILLPPLLLGALCGAGICIGNLSQEELLDKINDPRCICYDVNT